MLNQIKSWQKTLLKHQQKKSGSSHSLSVCRISETTTHHQFISKLGNENESLLLSSNTCCSLSVQQPFPKKRKLEEERASTTSSKSSANI